MCLTLSDAIVSAGRAPKNPTGWGYCLASKSPDVNVSRPYQTLNNQYSAQVPLSHNCDPRPRTRHLGGGSVLAQAIRQLDKPTEWHRTGCAITTRTQITTLRNFRLSHVTGCAFPLCIKGLGRTQTLQACAFNSATRGGNRTFAALAPMA